MMRRVILIALATICLWPSSASACERIDETIATQSIEKFVESTTCQLNLMRTNAGVGALRPDPYLAVSGKGHAVDMVANNYFSHTGLDGSSPGIRDQRAGYMGTAQRWEIGENLISYAPTPRVAVDSWIASPAHNYVLYLPKWKDLGIAATPQTGCECVMMAAEFGAKYKKRSHAKRRKLKRKRQ